MKRDRKLVTRDGLEWCVISRNERDTVYQGRHFFACRCRPGKPWHIHEHDQRISETGSAKVLNRFDGRYWIKTEILSEAVRILVAEVAP